MRIQKAPAYNSGFGKYHANGSDDIAWVAGVKEIPGASKKQGSGEEVEKLAVGRTLPAGTVIQFKKFYFVRDYALAWLPGQDTSLPWYPGRGLFPSPTRFYVEFASEATSAIGRPFGSDVVLGYWWGCGTQLWAAPWEPKNKAPVFVGDLGRSFKPSR